MSCAVSNRKRRSADITTTYCNEKQHKTSKLGCLLKGVMSSAKKTTATRTKRFSAPSQPPPPPPSTAAVTPPCGGRPINKHLAAVAEHAPPTAASSAPSSPACTAVGGSDVYLSPVVIKLEDVIRADEGTKENLYVSIGSPQVKLLQNPKPMTKVTTAEVERVSFRGKLNLVITMHSGTLAVHVIEARKLQSPWYPSALCSSFVDVSLTTYGAGVSRTFRTHTIYDTNAPHYDETFSFDLNSSDRHKRLQISVWDKSPTSSSSALPSFTGATPIATPRQQGHKLIGSMSFGMRNLVYKWKHVTGWYYLLRENLGKFKHLRVNHQEASTLCDGCTLPPQPPPTHCTSSTTTKLSFLLRASNEGFGFTVSGCHPVVISSVRSGSAAARVGLQPGDRVVTINGQNVSRSTSYTVTQLIKRLLSSGLDIRILRPSNNVSIPESLAPSAPWSATPSAVSDYDDIASSVCLTAKSSVESLHVNPHCHKGIHVLQDDMRLSYRIDSDFDSVSCSGGTVKRSRCDGASDTHHLCPSLDNAHVISEASRSRSAPPPHVEQSHVHIDSCDLSLAALLNDVLHDEESYVSQMRFGLERFSRPLLHSLLTATEHRHLFRNIEKVVAVSDYCSQQLLLICEDLTGQESPQRRDLTSGDLSAVLSVYTQRLQMLTDIYKTYCSSIQDALHLLTRLQSNPKVCKFQQTPPVPEGYPNLPEFISRPQDHIEKLAETLQEISSALRRNESENCCGDLKDLIESLKNCIPPERESPRHSDCEGDQLECGFVEDDSIPEPTADDTERPSFYEDVMKRLDFSSSAVFCNKTSLGSCRLVYMSEVMYAENWQWIPMVLVLLDEILLLAECDPDGKLSVKLDPVHLSAITECDQNCYHPCEFSFTTSSSNTLVFRTEVNKVKETWCYLLSGSHNNNNNDTHHLQHTSNNTCTPQQKQPDNNKDNSKQHYYSTPKCSNTRHQLQRQQQQRQQRRRKHQSSLHSSSTDTSSSDKSSSDRSISADLPLLSAEPHYDQLCRFPLLEVTSSLNNQQQDGSDKLNCAMLR